MTQWKTIDQYPNYEVSSTGLVRNKISNHVLKPTQTLKGYLRVNLYNNRGYKPKKIHRLVAEAFINNPNPEEFTQVNHKNSCKADNRA